MRDLTVEEEQFAAFLFTYAATARTLSAPTCADISAVGLLRLKIHDPAVRARTHDIARDYLEQRLAELMAETEKPTRTSDPNAQTDAGINQ